MKLAICGVNVQLNTTVYSVHCQRNAVITIAIRLRRIAHAYFQTSSSAQAKNEHVNFSS